MAQAEASFTPGSNSSRHITNPSNAPLSTTDCSETFTMHIKQLSKLAWANSGECFATARKTNAAAFL